MNIELKNVTKYYDKKVLDNLSVCIKDVNAIGIIGASGCGKSTLIRQIAGLEFVDSGEILVDNRLLTQEMIEEYREHIGYVFQKHNLFPHLTLKENLLLILTKIKKINEADALAKIDELFELLHLQDQADKKPNSVSGGQAQRASIARALSTNPDLILLDEPTSSLDPVLANEVLESIMILKNTGKDFIFATHELAFLKNFGDYLIFMDNGKIIEHGPISLIESPRSELLQNFLKKGGVIDESGSTFRVS